MYTTYAKQYDSAARDNIYNALLERPSTIALLDDVKRHGYCRPWLWFWHLRAMVY